jgi:serine protease Do
VIVEYSGKPVADSNDLPLTIAELKEEEVVAAAPQKESAFGLAVQNLTPEIAQSLGIGKLQGVVITGVLGGSPADDAGLRRGDVLLEIDRKLIRNVGNYKTAMDALKKGESTLFLVQRGQTTSFIAFKVPTDRAPS